MGAGWLAWLARVTGRPARSAEGDRVEARLAALGVGPARERVLAYDSEALRRPGAHAEMLGALLRRAGIPVDAVREVPGAGGPALRITSRSVTLRCEPARGAGSVLDVDDLLAHAATAFAREVGSSLVFARLVTRDQGVALTWLPRAAVPAVRLEGLLPLELLAAPDALRCVRELPDGGEALVASEPRDTPGIEDRLLDTGTFLVTPARRVDGVPIVGPAALHRTGRLARAVLAEDADVRGVPCRGGTPIELGEDGLPLAFTLARPHRFGPIEVLAGARVAMYESGRVPFEITLAEPQDVRGRRLAAGAIVDVGEDGEPYGAIEGTVELAWVDGRWEQEAPAADDEPPP